MVRKKPTRYRFGEVKITHRGNVVNTSVGNKAYDDLVKSIERRFEYDVGFIPAGYAHRPDLISYLFYGSPENWWLLMLVNGVTDPFEGFAAGDRILIPKLN
jgi:hypothetical protein